MSGIIMSFAGGASITPPGQNQYCGGTYTWVAPSGITSISVVVVGSGGNGGAGACTPGGGGAGGALSYINNYTVSPGNSYTVVAGAGGVGSGNSYFVSCLTVAARNGGNGGVYTGGVGGIVITGTGGAGGNGGSTGSNGGGSSGGGAGGYSGAGGAGVGNPTTTG